MLGMLIDNLRGCFQSLIEDRLEKVCRVYKWEERFTHKVTARSQVSTIREKVDATVKIHDFMDLKKIQIPNTIFLVSNERALLEYFMQF